MRLWSALTVLAHYRQLLSSAGKNTYSTTSHSFAQTSQLRLDENLFLRGFQVTGSKRHMPGKETTHPPRAAGAAVVAIGLVSISKNTQRGEPREGTCHPPRVHQAQQQRAVRPMEGPNTWKKQYLWPLHARGAFCCPQATEARKISGSGFSFPEFIFHTGWVSSQILVLWFPHFLHAPTQNSKDLEKSTNSSDP